MAKEQVEASVHSVQQTLKHSDFVSLAVDPFALATQSSDRARPTLKTVLYSYTNITS